MIPWSLLIRCSSVFTGSIPWAGPGGRSESEFHSVFPVVFVISGPFSSQIFRMIFGFLLICVVSLYFLMEI